MTVTYDQVLARLGATDVNGTDAASALTLAQSLVTQYIGDVVVPVELSDEAVLRTAVDLYNRADSPNGVVLRAYDDVGGPGSSQVIRAPADPLYSARMLLASYVAPLGFA